MSQVTKATINSLLISFSKQLQKEGKDNWKVNACIRCLKAFFNLCIDIGGVKMDNPVVGLKKYPVKIFPKYIPPENEVKEVFKICTSSQRFLLTFIEETGCRVMEAVRLKYSDIDTDTVTLYTRKSKNSNLTPRSIPKPKCLKKIVGKGKVFKEWNQAPRFLEEKIKKLNISNWSYHNLRHRRASIWANNRMSLIEIQYRLGHANLQTTQGYLQLLKKNFR